jgi:hypothetical protein
MYSDQTIAGWEDDGGAVMPSKRPLVGTVNQIAWALQIRADANAEFDPMAVALKGVARRQTGPNQSRTRTILAILEEKRDSMLAPNDAGYFIHDWQELRDQVRLLILHDPRCKNQDGG